ncbi:TetR/AcrR family transcriptional regulator [Rathayibacter soli]|uniref:TetR/AcrR family transcriptional regulator n=1 Tax=Rathayibacter soli TaxID=3144168 RepID=UPI0027E463D7|nr:TetR family transcriptional regulator C-terminal domain-containing protein [Glaciibacter superstes]
MPRIPAAERRSALVRAAMRVVAERGVSAATTRAIVAEAGMSLASFHYAFTSRDELMGELINWAVDQEEHTIASALAPAPVPVPMRDAIRAGLEEYFIGVRQDPQREKAMFELTQYALRSPGMEELAQRQYRRYYALAESTLKIAADKSGQCWTRPLAEIAAALIALTDGLTMSWLVNRDDEAAAALMDFAADALARLAADPTQLPNTLRR